MDGAPFCIQSFKPPRFKLHTFELYLTLFHVYDHSDAIDDAEDRHQQHRERDDEQEDFVLHRKLLRCRHAMKIRKLRQERIREATRKRAVEAQHARNVKLMEEAFQITPPVKRRRIRGTAACP